MPLGLRAQRGGRRCWRGVVGVGSGDVVLGRNPREEVLDSARLGALVATYTLSMAAPSVQATAAVSPPPCHAMPAVVVERSTYPSMLAV